MEAFAQQFSLIEDIKVNNGGIHTALAKSWFLIGSLDTFLEEIECLLPVRVRIVIFLSENALVYEWFKTPSGRVAFKI